jgi:lipopolysaccharide export system protein LptA
VPEKSAHTVMKSFLCGAVLSLALGLFGGLAQAEKADRNKPMNVEADAMRYDDQKQTSVFNGRVVLTKGSILIRGDKIEVHQDADGRQFGLVTSEPGKAAFFRQKREGLDEFIEGEGESIDYDGRADAVKIVKNARLRRYVGARLNDEFTGAVIVYNNTTETFSIDGVAATGNAGPANGRVRAMLTPKPSASAAALPAASAASAPTLRSSTTLGEAVK